MPTFAVGLDRVASTLHVRTDGDRLKMVGVNARPVAAEVVQGETLWYRTNQGLVDHSVGVDLGSSTVGADASVAMWSDVGGPQPTAIWLWLDLA